MKPHGEHIEASGSAARVRRCVWVVVALVVAALCWCGACALAADVRQNGAVSVRDAILNGAVQCCAIEGSYPSSLEYLEEHYGVSVNREDYVITYQVFAENVMPTVVVMPR